MKIIKRITAILLIIVFSASFCVYAANKKEIPLVTPPNNTVFYEGKDWGYIGSEIVGYYNFDLSGTSVSYDGEVIKYFVFPWGPNMNAEPVSGKWTVGKNPVYIYVDDIDDFDGDVYAKSEITLAAIKKIEIETSPNTTLIEGVNWHYDRLGYIVADTIDLTGLSVKITYTDNKTETIRYGMATKELFTCSVPSSTDNLVLGKNKYLIGYGSKSAEIYFDFQKEQIVRAVVEKTPTLSDYEYKTNWKYVNSVITPTINLKGLSVSAVYNSGKKESVSYDSSPSRFTVKSGQKFSSGKNTCVVMLDNKFEFNIYLDILRYGDVDSDGFINSSDALAVLRYSVKLTSFDDIQKKYSDVNADGMINSSDALSILNFSVGAATTFAAEK